MTYTAATFPWYTPHGFDHSKNVVKNLNWIIPDSVKPTLNDHEIFFLVLAAWLHDWGMVWKAGEDPKLIRPIHQIRTEQNLLEFHDKLGLNLHEGEIVGRIARGHRKEDLLSPLFDPVFYSANIRIDIRFLSALLRLADECDITFNRVPEIVYYYLNPKDASEDHFKSHLSIGGIGMPNEYKIEFNAIAFDPQGAEVLHTVERKIQTEVDTVKGILNQHKIPIENVEGKIYAQGFIDKPISFDLDKRRVTQLLIGEAIYSRKDVAIRELIQNSVDSCRFRRDIDAHYRPNISLAKDDGKLVVEDNGQGMDYEVAFNFLARKGFSYYQSDEFMKLRSSLTFDPISKWGLGILSCFMIASKVEINTRQKDKEPCRFIISDVGERWRYEPGTRNEIGTTITLYLNDEGEKINVEQALRHYVKSSDVPIFLGKNSRTPIEFSWDINDPDVEASLRRNDEDSKPWKIKSDRTYETSEMRVRYYMLEERYPSSLFIANQGFFVESATQSPDLDIPVGNGGIVLIDLKRDLLDLDVSRDKIATGSQRYFNFRETWYQFLISLLDKQLERINAIETMEERVIEFHGMLEELGLSPEKLLGEVRRRDKKEAKFPDCYTELATERTPYILIKKDRKEVTSLKKLALSDPSKVHIFQSTGDVESLKVEVQFLSRSVGPTLPEEEVIMVVSSVHSFAFGGTQKGYKGLFSKLGMKGEVVNETLYQFANRLDIKTERTALGALLPAGGVFCRMPETLRSGVIVRNFSSEITAKVPHESHEDYLAISTGLQIERDHIDEAILPLELARHLLGLQTSKGVEITKEGDILFDLEDEFVQLLHSKSDEILSRQELSILVRHYLAELAATFLIANDYAFDSISLREEEISTMLQGSKAVTPLIRRMAAMSKRLLENRGAMYVYQPKWNLTTLDYRISVVDGPEEKEGDEEER